MMRHLILEHEQETSKCVKTQSKKLWEIIIREIKSTDAIQALKFTDRISAKTDKNKTESLNFFSSSVVTNDFPSDWDVVKQHVQKRPDDLKFITELALEQINSARRNQVFGS